MNAAKIAQPTADKYQSKFDLGEDFIASFNMGRMIPIYCRPLLPGDSIKYNVEALVRFSALLAPVMHRAYLKIRGFKVLNRMLWPQWDEYITEQNIGITGPFFSGMDVPGEGSLADYLGIPTNIPAASSGLPVSAFPFAAYALIRDEWYRNQFVMTNEVFTELVSGNNNSTGS